MAKSSARDSRIRAALETIGCELFVSSKTYPMLRLRIEQARDRSGLDSLLEPALDCVELLVKSHDEMASQLRAAMRELSEYGDARTDV